MAYQLDYNRYEELGQGIADADLEAFEAIEDKVEKVKGRLEKRNTRHLLESYLETKRAKSMNQDLYDPNLDAPKEGDLW